MDTWEGKSTIPLSLHKYLYANGDPANHIDPSGFFSISNVLVSGAIITALSAITVGIVFKATGGSFWKGFVVGGVLGISLVVAWHSGTFASTFASALLQGFATAAIDMISSPALGISYGYNDLIQSFLSGFAFGAAGAAFEGALVGPALAALSSVIADIVGGIGSDEPYSWPKILANAIVSALLAKFTSPGEKAVFAVDQMRRNAAINLSDVAKSPGFLQTLVDNAIGTGAGTAIGVMINNVFGYFR